MVCLFILNILFARYYAASTSGWVLYLFAVNAFIIQVVSFSLESGIAYYSARSEIGDSRLVTFSLLWTLFASCITLIIYFLWYRWFPGSIQYPISYPLSFVCGNMLIAFGNAFCYSKYNFALPSMLTIGISLMLIAILVAVHYVQWKIDFISLYFYSFLVQGILLFISLFVTFRHIRITFEIPAGGIKKIFHYSFYAFMANLLFLAFTRVDYIFIKNYCSAEDLGNYIQVSKIAQVFFILPAMISTVLFPVIASGSQTAIRSRLKKISFKLLILYSGCCLFLTLFGKWLFPWLYGSSFSNMYVPFILIIPGILSMSDLYPYTAYYSGNNRIGVNIRGSVIALLFIIAGDAIFVPVYGINAAALVCSGGYFIYRYYVLSIFKKEVIN